MSSVDVNELTCKLCTFVNERGTKICDACGRTLNAPSIDLIPTGIICPRCTYDNPINSVTCAMCELGLPQSTIDQPNLLRVTMEECQICLSSMSEVFEMPVCSHIFCVGCAKKHFTTKILLYGHNTFRCPVDVCPYFDELSNKTKFFNDLKLLLKDVLDENTYETYSSKIAILDIIDKPGFIRCPYCNHGFIKSTTKMVYCHGCKVTFCCTCYTKWESGHSQVNCNLATNGSGDVLSNTNAFCPKCKYKYYLERGGCMHITCSQCSYEYCEFCFQKITGKGKSCGFPNCTKQQSLHGHHPRNCMYYVQEMDHTKLETLLQAKAVQYKAVQSRTSSKCEIKISVDIDGSWRDSSCGKAAKKDYNNMCLHHYKWHLGELMKRHNVDVVDGMNSLECSCELKRNNIKIPNAQKEYQSIEDGNTIELRKLIKLRIPYKKLAQ